MSARRGLSLGLRLVGGLSTFGAPVVAVALVVMVGAGLAAAAVELQPAGAYEATDAEIAELTGQGVDGQAAGPYNSAQVPEKYRAFVLQAGSRCTGISPGLIAAQIETESSWREGVTSVTEPGYHTGGAQGIAQFMPATWASYGEDFNGDGKADPFDPADAIPTQGKYMCAILDEITGYITQGIVTGDPIQLSIAGYNAGPNAVRKAGGMPSGGEYTTETQPYVQKILTLWKTKYADAPPTGPGSTGAPGAPVPPFTGAPGCSIPDPTGTGGCVTATMANAYRQTIATFGKISTSCWDEHAWNPTSDHPLGKGCDFTMGTIGKFPGPEDTAKGWEVANWMVANAGPLNVKYVIWQGKFWASYNSQGWVPYTGGGVYDPTDPTGGHYDHIHLSVKQ